MVVEEVTGTRTILGLHEGDADSLLSLDFWSKAGIAACVSIFDLDTFVCVIVPWTQFDSAKISIFVCVLFCRSPGGMYWDTRNFRVFLVFNLYLILLLEFKYLWRVYFLEWLRMTELLCESMVLCCMSFV